KGSRRFARGEQDGAEERRRRGEADGPAPGGAIARGLQGNARHDAADQRRVGVRRERTPQRGEAAFERPQLLATGAARGAAFEVGAHRLRQRSRQEVVGQLIALHHLVKALPWEMWLGNYFSGLIVPLSFSSASWSRDRSATSVSP